MNSVMNGPSTAALLVLLTTSLAAQTEVAVFNAGSPTGQIDVLVDTNFHAPLAVEIDQFAGDIARDTGRRVKVVSGSWTYGRDLRSLLLAHLHNEGLIGAILVGNLPVMKEVRVAYDVAYTTPTDLYYQSLTRTPWISETSTTFHLVTSLYYRDIWTSRLLPPGTVLTDRVELLRKYLARNHAYRTGAKTYDGMLYVNSMEMMYENGDVTSQLQDYVSKVGAYTGLYSDSTKVETAYALDHAQRRALILGRMQGNFEIADVHMHGSSTAQHPGGGLTITGSDLRSNPPGALFANLFSCAVGNLTNSDYLAGWYLFAGDTLLVRASTVTFIGQVGFSLGLLDDYKPLARGADPGNADRHAFDLYSFTLFGDPTITFRKAGASRLECVSFEADRLPLRAGPIDWPALDWSAGSPTLAAFDVRNVGSAPFTWKPLYASVPKLDNLAVFTVTLEPHPLGAGAAGRLVLRAGRQIVPTGTYSGVLFFETDAPSRRYMRVLLTLEVIGPPDLAAPACAIVSPTAGQTLSGYPYVKVVSSDDVLVTRTELYVDGILSRFFAGSTLALNTGGLYDWPTTYWLNGHHTLVAKAYDGAGHITTSSPVDVFISNGSARKPVITSPADGTVLFGSKIITVSVGASPLYATKAGFFCDGVLIGEDLTRDYSLTWNTRLVPDGAHTIEARLSDAAGNVSVSAPVSVSTLNFTPPSCSMTSPANGAVVSGTSTISVQAADDVGIWSVTLYRNGTWMNTIYIAPYSFAWDTSKLADGTYSLYAVAQDRTGNTTKSAPVGVTVNNGGTLDTTPPLCSITSPADGMTVSGTFALGASASDNVGVTSVSFYRDGVLLGTDTSVPFGLSWNTATATNGRHALVAKARDAAGQIGTSGTVTVTVSNSSADISGPTVAFTSPSNGAVVSGKVTLALSATDVSGVTRVDFFVNGALLATDYSAPYAALWNSRSKKGQTVTLTARAYDTKGNATANSISVRVQP